MHNINCSGENGNGNKARTNWKGKRSTDLRYRASSITNSYQKAVEGVEMFILSFQQQLFISCGNLHIIDRSSLSSFLMYSISCVAATSDTTDLLKIY